jgi:hypothetical protein
MKISIIIPVHEFNDVVSTYLDKAIESITKQESIEKQPKIIVISANNCADDVLNYLRTKEGLEYEFVRNESDNSEYQSQVNLAVKYVQTPYFTVLEFDDEISSTYIKNGEKYIKNYPNIDVFLTMMIEVNEKNEGIKLTNETVWAQQFVGENGEMGYLNLNSLKQYSDFKLSGAILKKSEFENLGGYKLNIKLTFMYEFLLRALNNASKVFSIPKIGYKHLATRENSLFDIYQKTMPINERKFWFETAVKESNFTSDRVIDMSRL